MASKKELSERDICTQFILPALKRVGWDIATQVREEVPNSMTEFKQIIGRGTRINEEYGKTFFTIMDFRNATDLSSDSDFDGEEVEFGDDETPEIKGVEKIKTECAKKFFSKIISDKVRYDVVDSYDRLMK